MKKIKNKRRYIYIVIILFIVIELLICFKYKSFVLLIVGAINFSIIMIILLFNIWKIKIINLKKIQYIFHKKKILKKIDKNELYLQNIKIKAFDGSYSVTHPSILYFDNKYSGYKYWLAFTPYNNNSVDLEIPSIRVSNDGIKFIKLDGGKDPLLEYIPKQHPLKYYSDPFLFYDNEEIELWYRLSIENTKNKTLKDFIYCIKTKNGINWTKPQKIFDDENNYMSLSIVKSKNKYIMYYFTTEYKIFSLTSDDKITWGNKKEVKVENFNEKSWHGEVKIDNNHIKILFMSKNYKLYYATTSMDNYNNFSNLKKIDLKYYDNSLFYGNEHLYKSSFLNINNKFLLYVPFRINCIKFHNKKLIKNGKWNLTLTMLNNENVNLIFDENRKECIK